MAHARHESEINNFTPTVFIAGAGVGGCFTALELAEKKDSEGRPKYKIILADKNDDVLKGSSNATPGRMGLGFHYVHRPTALMYLKATIAFQRKYAQFGKFRVGDDLAEDNPRKHMLQSGRYFIVKGSRPGKEEILKTYVFLQEEYRKLVQEDEGNKVFGEPDDFFRLLVPEEYSKDVDAKNVDVGVETAECLLNWPLFREYIKEELHKHDNIEIKVGTSVEGISQHLENFKYVVKTAENAEHKLEEVSLVEADVVVNCTWENARALNATAGLKKPEEVRTNRLKAVIFFVLPEEHENTPSGFFCMGPYCMFSNLGVDHLGRHIGAATYAPKTSMKQSTAQEVPEEINRYLRGEATEAEKTKIGEEIKKGVAKFIPGMENAKILRVDFGIVQTKGEVDIFDPTSEFSLRDYNGISVEQLNFVTNACMKLLYGPDNGEIAVDLVEMHMHELDAVKKYIASLNDCQLGFNSYQPESAEDKPKTYLYDANLARFAALNAQLKKQITSFADQRNLNLLNPGTVRSLISSMTGLFAARGFAKTPVSSATKKF